MNQGMRKKEKLGMKGKGLSREGDEDGTKGNGKREWETWIC